MNAALVYLAVSVALVLWGAIVATLNDARVLKREADRLRREAQRMAERRRVTAILARELHDDLANEAALVEVVPAGPVIIVPREGFVGRMNMHAARSQIVLRRLLRDVGADE